MDLRQAIEKFQPFIDDFVSQMTDDYRSTNKAMQFVIASSELVCAAEKKQFINHFKKNLTEAHNELIRAKNAKAQADYLELTAKRQKEEKEEEKKIKELYPDNVTVAQAMKEAKEGCENCQQEKPDPFNGLVSSVQRQAMIAQGLLDENGFPVSKIAENRAINIVSASTTAENAAKYAAIENTEGVKLGEHEEANPTVDTVLEAIIKSQDLVAMKDYLKLHKIKVKAPVKGNNFDYLLSLAEEHKGQI